MSESRRVAIVTGASSGVGAACARQLARAGWNVVINYLSNDAGAEETAHACERAGVEALAAKGDVSEDAVCRSVSEAARTRWGRVDALVNNAGTTKFCPPGDLDGLSAEDFMRIYAVNVIGPYQMTRAVAPLMRDAGGGGIVNVASMAGITGLGSSTAYAASKGALITMTLSLARVLGPDIRVNAVCPGFIKGDWLRRALGEERYESVKEAREAAAPLRMTMTADAVADGIFYFLTRAEGVTGETLMMDGGHHLYTTPLARS